jgi:hypothetical protein
MATDILDVIDGALADYATSDDAMRWMPPDSRAPEPIAAPPVTVDIRLNVEPFAAELQRVGEALIAAMQPWAEAFGKLFRELAPAVQVINDAHREHMSAVHREYARRQKARKRRR